MHIPVPFTFPKLWRGPSVRLAIIGGAVALGATVIACGGDSDEDPDATPATGGVATATSEPSPQATTAGGTLTPLETPTEQPSPTPSSTGSTPDDPQMVAEMIDLAPCSDETYYEEQVLPNGIHAVTYKDVPVGTPILFPFEEGRLRLVDARAGAILLVYDVEGVGVFSVQAAGTDTLDRNLRQVQQGTVIGHFGGTFGEEETDVFEGYQLFAVAGTTEIVQVDDQFYNGQALDPNIEDCHVLP